MKLAYADPPYPGKAHLYPENTEVDHAALIAQLERDYDGWALSTDERNLAYVLSLCPAGTRVLAWCRPNAVPHRPQPYAAWEPVLLRAARSDGAAVRTYHDAVVPSGRGARQPLVGQKPPTFCEWVIRCLGAIPGDTLDDLYPGTGAMTRAWERWETQPCLTPPSHWRRGGIPYWNELRRWNTSFDGLVGSAAPERGKR